MQQQAIPDVSAQSRNFIGVVGDVLFSFFGTSASSPTMTGLVALLNSARLSEHMPALGFLNPLLYAIQEYDPSAFNDITEGNNPGCGTQGFNVSFLFLFPGQGSGISSLLGHEAYLCPHTETIFRRPRKDGIPSLAWVPQTSGSSKTLLHRIRYQL